MEHFMKKRFLKLHQVLIPKVCTYVRMTLIIMYVCTYMHMKILNFNSGGYTKEKLHKIMSLLIQRLHENNCSNQTTIKSRR